MIHKVAQAESTNDFLRDLISENSPSGTVIWTENQTQGKGSFGNRWISEKGQNLTFSYLLRHFVSIDKQISVSWWVSVCLWKALAKIGVESQIKWPNDIIVGGKKVGGILIEPKIVEKNCIFFIVGVGINLNQTQFENLPKASSLKLETGKDFILEEMLTIFVETFNQNISALEDPNELLLFYNQHLYKKDKVACFKFEEQIYNGVIRQMLPDGKLLVELQEKGSQIFAQKQIELLF
ncbi:MAG: biotin--[acetyl-CoA-carboxylase] ligase [Flavobacteriaceae bacterium]|nr:MAG: biotin--[acetyl-CoA-carboxylase] ligase [Flavobacteriaceae bacterium]